MSDIPVSLDPAEFYRATLENEGLKPEPVDMQKFAEANKVSMDVAELAKRYFEQLQLDGVKYASEDKRLEDAIAIAKAYFEQVETARKTARAVVDSAVQKLAEAAKALIEEQKLSIAPYDLIQYAADQIVSITECEALQASKTAELDAALMSGLSKEAVKTAALKPLFLEGKVSPEALHPEWHEGFAQLTGQPFKGDQARQWAHQQLGVAKPEEAATKLIAAQGHIDAGKPLPEALALVRNPPSWFSQNKGLAVGGGLAAGALGLGALALMHQKRKDRDDKMRAALMSQGLSASGAMSPSSSMSGAP
jgi:protein-disulfide isomerase-like protein with CxxC motif